MLAAILAILSSTGVGSIVGLIGGLMNRGIDIKAKALDQKFELEKLKAEREFLVEEIKGRVEVATIEADKAIETAGYQTMSQSYSIAVPTSKDGWIDKASKLVRPVLTICFFFFTIYIFVEVQAAVTRLDAAFSQTEILELYKYIIQWALFQAGVSIGWWFAMRPGRMPTFGGK